MQRQERTLEANIPPLIIPALPAKLNIKSSDPVYINDTLIPELKKILLASAADLLGPSPLVLPPLRPINHKLNLINDSLIIRHHAPKCADAYRNTLRDKIMKYCEAGWWVEAAVPSAAPLMTIPKKDGTLRTPIDARKRNDNTVKDVTPLPDQDMIRHDVSRANYRSKIDLRDAYEQVRVEPEDTWKTAFATVLGTYLSMVMQIGDCNATNTMQRLMTFIFRKHLGDWIHVLLDDLYIFSATLADHYEHLMRTLHLLRYWRFYFSEKKKVDLFSKRMECLGHIIDDDGLHIEDGKLAVITQWRTPREVKDIQRFLGVINYISEYLPSVSSYTSPLSALTRKDQIFLWTPMHDNCFEQIKHIVSKASVLSRSTTTRMNRFGS